MESTMNAPSVSEAYTMIRLLKKRALKGDADKIRQLELIIAEAKDKAAALALERFFPAK